jgi:uncharacterized protein YjbI with pentapeptide repeats
MRMPWVIRLLIAVLFSASLAFPSGRAYAADPNALAQLRGTKSCDSCDLSGADLRRADLREANLSKAILFNGDLSNADLRGANLSGADLSEVNLSGADLQRANLSGAELNKVNLSGTNLSEANLSGVNLSGANLSGAKLIGANLIKINLIVADLSEAQLGGANLSGASLRGADLTKATLTRANLTDADLFQADMTNAYLSMANLTKANLIEADLTDANFEPIEVPPARSFLGVTGLDRLSWNQSPASMVLLRKTFQEAGMRQQEREVTYAQLRMQRINTGGLEGTLQYVLFEATCDWGMTPARPFWIMLGLIPLFTLLYTMPIAQPSPKRAVWRIWDKDRARKDQGQDDPEQVTAHGYRLPLYALFFSVLSAFHIGWRELNVGSWISRLNPYEFTLKGTGWVRTVSGVQSLISVYLLALAVLTYFGRPFE